MDPPLRPAPLDPPAPLCPPLRYNFADDVGGRQLLGEGWHGTHVAGIVAADTDNGVGVAGTAWVASLMTLTCFGTRGTSGFEESIVYAADNGASISQV